MTLVGFEPTSFWFLGQSITTTANRATSALAWIVLSNTFNAMPLLAWTSSLSKPLVDVVTHCQSGKHKQADTYTNKVVMLVACPITFVTPSAQGWHLNRALANICYADFFGNSNKCPSLLFHLILASIYLNISNSLFCAGIYSRKWREEGKKKEERDITV